MEPNLQLDGVQLPKKLETGLQSFCQALGNAYGENLECVLLYGGLARGEYLPRTSDVNMMVILHTITVEDLRKVLKNVRKSIRDFRLAPFFLSHEDLIRSTDVFPMKFLDIQENHHAVWGNDPFKDLEISREHLRLQCEQEVKNLMLRLRQFFLRRALDAGSIENILTDAISHFLVPLRVMIQLKNGDGPDKKRDLVDSASKAFDLDREALLQILRLKEKKEKMKRTALEMLYERFMNCVVQAANAVDSL
jgi:predicted nucleotidyltransferase